MIEAITFPLRGGAQIRVTRPEAVAAVMKAAAEYRAAMYCVPPNSPMVAILERDSIMLKAAAHFAAMPVATLEWSDSNPIRVTLLIDEAMIFEHLGTAMEIIDAELIRLREAVQQEITKRAISHAKER